MFPANHAQDAFSFNEQTFQPDSVNPEFPLQDAFQVCPGCMGGHQLSGVNFSTPSHHGPLPHSHAGIDAGAPYAPGYHWGSPSSTTAVDQSPVYQDVGGLSPSWQSPPRGPAMMRVSGLNPHMGFASRQHSLADPSPASAVAFNGATADGYTIHDAFGTSWSSPSSPFTDASRSLGFASPGIPLAMAPDNISDTDLLSLQRVLNPFEILQGPAMHCMQGISAGHTASPFATTTEASPATLNSSLPPGHAGSVPKERSRCNHCNATFAFENSRRRHQRLQHADEIDAYVIKDQRPVGQPSWLWLDKRLDECHECREGKPYGEQDAAKSHLISVHRLQVAGSGVDSAGRGMMMTIEECGILIRRVRMTRAEFDAKREDVQRTSP